MSPELIYFLKVNIAIALFYAFYRLFFYKDTFFQWRRITLLSFFAISILYPLMNIQEWVKEQEPMVVMADMYATVILPEVTTSDSPGAFNWKELLSSSIYFIYIGALALFSFRFLVQLFSIIKIRIKSESAILLHTKVYILSKPQGPFSFFNWIFIHPESHTDDELDEILTHELTHVRQWHSVDVIISEILCIICWFNPFMWLMKREVRGNLEFLADHKVLEKGHDHKTYQYHLLGLAHHKKVATLYNSFNVLPLKNRIKMMNKKRTKQIGRTKYALFIPLAAILLIISNIEAIARSTERLVDNVFQTEGAMPVIQQDKLVKYKGKVVDKNNKPLKGAMIITDAVKDDTFADSNGEFSFECQESDKVSLVAIHYKGNEKTYKFVTIDSSQNKQNIVIVLDESAYKVIEEDAANKSDDVNVIFEVVEKMPEFPGGTQAMMQFLNRNIKYPSEAQKAGTQGRVIAQFVVEKDGSTSEHKVSRSVSPELDAEALRVLRLMPKWQPGMQRGKAVRVKYTVPVVFRLSADDNKTEPKYTPEEVVSADGVTFEVVEQMPQFPNGMSALMEFISANLQYPESAKAAKTQGRVIVQFVVCKDGTIKDPRIVREVDPTLDAEAIRVIKMMPKWIPGKQKGKEVDVKYTVPVVFRLE